MENRITQEEIRLANRQQIYHYIHQNARASSQDICAALSLSRPTVASNLSALEAEKQSDDWLKENGRFVPGIVKWLEKENWRSFVQQAETVEEDEEWTSF